MKEKALEWGFDFSFQEMADFLKEYFSDHDFSISRQAIADHLRDAEWNVRAHGSRARSLCCGTTLAKA